MSKREQAKAYAQGGAAAISVLTEPERFGGHMDHLRAVAGAVAAAATGVAARPGRAAGQSNGRRVHEHACELRSCTAAAPL